MMFRLPIMMMFRLPIIRHIRWAWYSRRVKRWAAAWGSMGIGLGVPNKSDQEALDAIWRGDR